MNGTQADMTRLSYDLADAASERLTARWISAELSRLVCRKRSERSLVRSMNVVARLEVISEVSCDASSERSLDICVVI